MADLDLWLKFSKSITYADDTQTGVSGRILKLIIKKMEEDALNVLKFMASNGLVANPKKTTLLFLNLRKGMDLITINIGNEKITQEKNAKLLGMTLADNQTWKCHISGKGGVIANLNKRLFKLTRLRNHISQDCLKKSLKAYTLQKLDMVSNCVAQ